uniref:Uncharacterized protein n=1 Tax=Anguilla anguilla TaxID=7936 RepID=A0A0E9UVQ1_ANGAN
MRLLSRKKVQPSSNTAVGTKQHCSVKFCN